MRGCLWMITEHDQLRANVHGLANAIAAILVEFCARVTQPAKRLNPNTEEKLNGNSDFVANISSRVEIIKCKLNSIRSQVIQIEAIEGNKRICEAQTVTSDLIVHLKTQNFLRKVNYWLRVCGGLQSAQNTASNICAKASRCQLIIESISVVCRNWRPCKQCCPALK